MSRAAVEKELYYILGRITKDKTNIDAYKALFKGMSDKQFKEFFAKIKRGESKLAIFVPNQGDANMDLKTILEEGEKIGLKYFDKLVSTIDGMQVTSKQEAMLLLAPVRRLAQTLDAKISVSTDDTKTDALTGQVTGESKSASLGIPETRILADTGYEASATEIMTVRGGDDGAYSYLVASTTSTGGASLNGALSARTNVKSKHAVRTLLTGKHIGNNL